jgi:uncharacterized protein YgbK (DUF1537 family)
MSDALKTKIIVLDDDPTGSQTVHGCLLLTRWDVATLQEALNDTLPNPQTDHPRSAALGSFPSPIFFVLTNTRGMSAEHAASVTREVCRNLKRALAGRDLNPIFVSRSDSTLRGHYPVETDVMAEELGPFDAHFLVPAFFEGGRSTRDSVHYLKVDGKDVPVHETEFARDSVFGFHHSYLPDYVEEKTRGRIKAAEVKRFLLKDVRAGVQEPLMRLTNNACVVVDAEIQSDLNRFAVDVMAAVAAGKRFLFRSAASLLTALAKLPAQPTPPESMVAVVRGQRAGAVIVGSHVPKTSRQLQALLTLPNTVPIEVNVNRLPEEGAVMLSEVLECVQASHRANQTAVVFTSRGERQFATEAMRLQFGEQVSAFLVNVVRGLPPTLGFLVSKGGITSNDVLSTGLGLRTTRLLGQILPGVSVVRCPDDHPQQPKLPVVIFPGNVGDDAALATVVQRLTTPPASS